MHELFAPSSDARKTQTGQLDGPANLQNLGQREPCAPRPYRQFTTEVRVETASRTAKVAASIGSLHLNLNGGTPEPTSGVDLRVKGNEYAAAG
jgi:hypothetical protein